ncbi:hypothetical protein STRIP9103_04212 [Streptomyces ipomoeae 91-03]|uniref:Uncharacterized protein n=1 Tax=Streptomyces ipomoeae 91-03 TaxID=698759 RepID=L1KGU0_9ACTN|nr:hypothetical protein STRIP9103_04212 [Streptomyces ipomoeae 91-03]
MRSGPLGLPPRGPVAACRPAPARAETPVTAERDGYLPTAAATATTANISTSTPAMIRLRVFGSTHRA